MLLRLPHPASWTDFESLCHLLWKEIWQDPNAKKNGRLGQPQKGVDIFGIPLYSNSYEGVQCKDKNDTLGSKLTTKELLEECYKATTFEPKLSRYTIATTAASDVFLQQETRGINESKEFSFDIDVWSWDEIETEVRSRERLMEFFYKGYPVETQDSVRISAIGSKNHFEAFFTRPNLWVNVSDKLRIALKLLSCEICENAYRYGEARSVVLSFDGTQFLIQDDGKEFNVLDKLIEFETVSLDEFMGSRQLKLFLDRFKNSVCTSYTQSDEFNNIFKIEICNALEHADTKQEITIKAESLWGRHSGRRYAQSLNISDDIKELVLNFDNEAASSASAAVIGELRHVLREEIEIIAFVNEDSSLIGLDKCIDGVTIKKKD